MQHEAQDEVSLLQSTSSVRHGGQRPESDEDAWGGVANASLHRSLSFEFS